MTGIAFSRAWEDDRLDLDVLGIGPGERVLVVAAAGDLALAVAAAGAARVVAVDTNPAQLHLAALKVAAAGSLDVAERHAWFEVGRVAGARTVYRHVLRDGLDPAAAAFWDRHIGLFEYGFHDRVGVGRSFNRLGRLARLLVPSMAGSIERVATVDEQAAYWRARVRGRLFGPLTHWLFAHTPALAPLAPNAHELRRMRVGAYSRALEARIEGVVGRTLVREHPWWRPALGGRPAAPGHGAAWLDEERSAGLAARAGRIELVEGDLVEMLTAQPAGSLDAVSVSNVPDWLAPGDQRQLRAALVRALRRGGRVLARAVLADESSLAGDGLARDPVSDELPGRDRTALYGRVDLLRRV